MKPESCFKIGRNSKASHPREFRAPSAIAMTRAQARERSIGRAGEELRNLPELELEIGCGVGWHSLSRAMNLARDCRTSRGVVAIERTREKFDAFARRFAKHSTRQLPNLTGVQADARLWCAREVTAQIFDQVWILYPNPEPGRPQRNWLREPFFSHLTHIVKSGGLLNLATNSENYFTQSLEAHRHWRGFWEIQRSNSWSKATEPKFQARTHFERKYFERGQNLFELELIRLPHLDDGGPI
jgi:tRNA G46 methylase TrmB